MTDTKQTIDAKALNDFSAGAEAAMREQIAAGIPAALVLNALFAAVTAIAIETVGGNGAVRWLQASVAAAELGVAEGRRAMAN